MSQALRKAGIKQNVGDLIAELKDGLLLIQLVEAMSGKSFGAKPKPTNVRIQQIDNVNRALGFVKDNGIKHKASAEGSFVRCSSFVPEKIVLTNKKQTSSTATPRSCSASCSRSSSST